MGTASPFRTLCPQCGSAVVWGFDPAQSEMLDTLAAIYDKLCEVQEELEGVLP